MTSVTNTRVIGVRHKIELYRGEKGLGFGVSSRDVSTNDRDHPIYVKFIHSEGPAFYDGRLKLGDRILEVRACVVSAQNQLHRKGTSERQAHTLCRCYELNLRTKIKLVNHLHKHRNTKK